MDQAPGYLVIGHITKDLLPGGGFRTGGTATYASLTAHLLGLRTAVVTSAEPGFCFAHAHPSIMVRCHPAERTTTFENVYSGGVRRQHLRCVANRLTGIHIPDAWRRADLVHLGPVAQEVDPRVCDLFPSPMMVVTPQGWMRSWDATGAVTRCKWPDAEHVLRRADVVVLSMEDLGGDEELLEHYVRRARHLVLTLGENGAMVFSAGRSERVPAYGVCVADPTGAGDVFAAAYVVRYAETGDTQRAAQFANSAASFVVEGAATDAVPTRDPVEWRMRHGRRRE